MSRWAHSICSACFRLKRPGVQPVALIGPPLAVCCWCGKPNADGIYYRDDPEKVPCKGEGPERQENDQEG